MKEEDRVFLRYLMFTVPHATVLAGALLGVMLVLRVKPEVAAGVFSLFYGVLLSILAAIVRDHFSKSYLYKAFVGIGVLLLVGGIAILFSLR
ncbi:hypothetical protein [Thermococcus stetteri]|uniref:hypothetical protein n=1 Tax=Thermococcus stetteri TaxID=49900 RepID=UPI001AE6FE3B|nr:hypothetical protein [Thermococcus stetteri]MBP1911594.1 FtsH-binding integral membrane protein [Thermococcus stetteri]